MTQYRTVLAEIADAMWVTGDLSRYQDLVTPDFQVHGLEDVYLTDVADGLRFYRMAREQIENIQIDIDRELMENEWEVIMGRFRAFEIGTDREINVPLTAMASKRDGRVAELYVTIDFLKIFQQLGRLPSHTREMCLLRVPMAL